MYHKIMNFKSWIIPKANANKFLRKKLPEVDNYDTSPAFQALLPIRRDSNALMGLLDSYDKIAFALHKGQVQPTPKLKQDLRRVHQIIADVFGGLHSLIHPYCRAIFASRYLQGCAMTYWAFGKQKKALRSIGYSLDLLDEPNRFHTVLLYLSVFPGILVGAKAWDMLDRLIRVVSWFNDKLPLAKQLHEGATTARKACPVPVPLLQPQPQAQPPALLPPVTLPPTHQPTPTIPIAPAKKNITAEREKGRERERLYLREQAGRSQSL